MSAKRKVSKAAPAGPQTPAGWQWWHSAIVAVVLALVALEVYWPALSGPFMLDDLYLPYGRADAASTPVEVWMARRPLLGLTFYWNWLQGGAATFTYHIWNLILHLGTAGLVYLVLDFALGLTGVRSRLAAGFGAAVFLLHPLQTEAVAYVASRSDVLSTLLAYGALAVYFGRRESMGWGRVAAVLVLFGAAVTAKEQAAALPAAFVLGDLLLRGGWAALKGNWRLHGPVVAGGVLGVVWILAQLAKADTAGFNTAGVTPVQYFLTQGRAIWHYLRLFVLPVGQNVDPDFALSAGAGDVFALAGWAGVAGLVAVAWMLRERAPLASFGILLFLTFLAPTSSFVPIKDPVAERRMYFPMIGLLAVAAEGVRRLPRTQGTGVALAAVLAVFSWATYARASAWGSTIALWEDSVAGSPEKWRPRFQLAQAYYDANRCADATREFAKAAAIDATDTRLLMNWALALDCEGRADEAVAQLQKAAAMENTAHIQATIGMVQGKRGRAAEALAALEIAERLDPRFAATYAYRGNVLAGADRWEEAAAQFRKALEIEPANQAALQGWKLAQARLRR